MKKVQTYQKIWVSVKIAALLIILSPLGAIAQTTYKLNPSTPVFRGFLLSLKLALTISLLSEII